MKFKLTFTAVREFEVPEGATDEEYDQLKELAKLAMGEMDVKPDMFTVERIDVPAEEPPKYERNLDCQD
jgi:hypothetical protein